MNIFFIIFFILLVILFFVYFIFKNRNQKIEEYIQDEIKKETDALMKLTKKDRMEYIELDQEIRLNEEI